MSNAAKLLTSIYNLSLKRKGVKEMAKDKCDYCNGRGKVECDCTGGLGKSAANDDCPACNGSGIHSCPACKGKGEK
jgi:DnaJ-class molecular chaperone